jgi:Ca2+-binding RTX toxin-like protein
MPIITGTNGNEYLNGTAGDDTLLGLDGADNLEGHGGDDLLDGGDGGFDYAIYGNATSGVSVNLTLAGPQAVGGGEGNDTLLNIEGVVGSAYGDTLIGDAGENHFTPGAGDDVIDGSAGLDTVQYWGALGPVTVNLGISGPQAIGGGMGADTLISIERVHGGNFNDLLIGTAFGWDGLNGGAGADTLQGLGGDWDDLHGEAGDDLLDGGPGGNDAASYWSATGGVRVDLNLQGVAQVVGGGHGTDTLIGIENLNGSAFNDTLIGNGGNNYFQARAGDDSVLGGGGVDTIDYYEGQGVTVDLNISGPQTIGGGMGVDTLVSIESVAGSWGSDRITGNGGDNWIGVRTGSDTVDGGAGRDGVHFGEVQNAIHVDLALAGENVIGADGNDTLVNVEQVNGTAFNDTLLGNTGDNGFEGLGGDDLIDGRGGWDVVGYYNATGGVSVDLTVSGPQTVGGGQGVDTLLGIEQLDGSQHGDTLTGDDQANSFTGMAGDDVIYGRGGFDSLNYWSATGGVTVNLSVSGPQNIGGGEGTDTLLNIENINATQWGDHLTGNEAANFFSPTAGADTYFGLGGNDNLQGGQGDDLIDGGEGADNAGYFSANAGVTVDLRLAGPQNVGADQGVDTLVSIENLGGSDVGDDRLTGSAANNALNGNGGADTLIALGGDDFLQGAAGADSLDGGVGNDVLVGGGGNDTLVGGGGFDTAQFSGPRSAYTIVANGADGLLVTDNRPGSPDGADTLVGIWRLQFSDGVVLIGGANGDQLNGAGQNDTIVGFGGDDFLRGNAGNDSLSGGDGHDFLAGGPGDDTLDGGAGFDRASYFNPLNGVNVDLALAGPQATGQGFDTLVSVEHVSGTTFSDTLAGDDGANWLWGSGGGDDILSGRGGDDLLWLGAGGHQADGGAGIDTVGFGSSVDIGGAVNVSLALQGAAQVTGRGSMTLTNVENLSGSEFNDTLTGDGGANLLAGHLGSDSLLGGEGGDLLYGDGAVDIDSETGGSGPIDTFADVSDHYGVGGSDTLKGGGGDDTLVGGRGNDSLAGEAGQDRAVFSGARADYQIVLLANGDLEVTDLRAGGDGVDILTGVETLAFSDQSIPAPAPTTNTAPVAAADSASVNEDAQITINVLGNDTDADAGDTLTLVSVGPTASGGSVSIVNGQVVYAANADSQDLLAPGQTAQDSFSYTVRDAAGATSTATVTVTVTGVADGATKLGGNGQDTLVGGDLDERLDGGNGKDLLRGEGGADTLLGGNGEDDLFGGTGADLLVGGNGGDLLVGDHGADTLTGDNGPDVFVFGPASGQDRITDFDNADVIRFEGGVFTSFAQVMSHAVQQGGDVLITTDAGDSVRLVGMSLSGLNAGDFVFG